MNIFYIDTETEACAQYHNDKHCVKMILESAQLLCTAHRVLDGHEYVSTTASGRKVTRWDHPLDNILMKATHVNHPSAVWVRESTQHYHWLFSLFHELLVEYTHRYGKHHACERLLDVLSATPTNLRDNGFVQPPLAMPDECKISSDAVECYREYYRVHKKAMSTWKNRDIPFWFQ